MEVGQAKEILPERRYQLRHQLRQPHGPESRCRLLHDQRVLCLRGRRCRREAVGARLLGVGRCMQRGPDAQAALGRYGAAPVLRVERTAGLQRAGGGAAGRQVLPDRHDLLVGDLRRALDELLGLRGESESGRCEGFSTFHGAVLEQAAADSLISDLIFFTEIRYFRLRVSRDIHMHKAGWRKGTRIRFCLNKMTCNFVNATFTAENRKLLHRQRLLDQLSQLFGIWRPRISVQCRQPVPDLLSRHWIPAGLILQ